METMAKSVLAEKKRYRRVGRNYIHWPETPFSRYCEKRIPGAGPLGWWADRAPRTRAKLARDAVKTGLVKRLWQDTKGWLGRLFGKRPA